MKSIIPFKFSACQIFISAIAWIWLTVLPASAQRYNFSGYTIANGLPSNHVNDVHQDKYGRLWVATMNGACWFDGQHFYRFEQDNPAASNPVKAIYEDKTGNLWMATRSGVGVFNGLKKKFFTIDDGLLSNNVTAIAQDAQGNFWIGTTEGLSKYDGKKFSSFTILKGLVSNEVTCLFADSKGRLWIGTTNGLSCHSSTGFTNYTINEGLPGSIVYCIREMEGGNIWIGTNEGIGVFNGKGIAEMNISYGVNVKKVTSIMMDYKKNLWFSTYGNGICQIDHGAFFTLTTDEGLLDNNVQCMEEDNEGNIWMGTSKGLCRYSGGRFVTYSSEDGLNDNRLLTTYCDKSNRIWMGMVNGGVNYIENNVVKNVPVASALNKATIWSITQDNAGNIWMGTSGGPVVITADLQKMYYPFEILNNKIIYTILANTDGSIWMGTDRGIYKYSTNSFKIINKLNGLTNDNIRYLFQDRQGLVWIGTMQGLYFMNGDDAVSLNDLLAINKTPVTAIAQDLNDNILFSNYDFGISVFSKTNKKMAFRHLDTKNGLINNRILCMASDQNYLWLGTPDGVDRIDWNTYLKREFVNIIHFDKSNGYFGVETSSASYDKNGYLWFASVNGAIRYNPGYGYSKSVTPVMLLQSITAYLRKVNWAEQGYAIDSTSGLPVNPLLPYGYNNLNFHFTGIYFAAPGEIKYRWKLKGFDDYWVPSTPFNVANYSNIPPGSYTFMVQASVNDRDWSPSLEYNFSIKAPVWRTNFFYFLYLLTAVGLVWGIMKLRTRSLRQAQLNLRQKINERTAQLREKNEELAKLSIVASETGNAVLIFDKNFNLEYANESFMRMTGYTKEEIISLRGVKLQQISYNENINEIIKDALEEKKSIVYESKTVRKDGKELWTSSTITPVYAGTGEMTNVVVIDTDITLRKKMEQQIRESLEEKNILLKEIHHRVKNNLQIIVSLFNLQSAYIHDKESNKVIREGQDRIRSMALIHDRFYQSEGTSRIDFDDYIKRLCDTIFQSQGADKSKIGLLIDADKISLDIDTAVPCGLIINELVSNAIKHAFTNRNGEIKITFKMNETGKHVLTIADNGAGLPANFNIALADTLGFQLVNVLTEQIDGNITVNQTNGFEIKIEF